MTPPADNPPWQPGASRQAIEFRARLLADIRAFLAARGVLEVETPLLSRFGNVDPNIGSMATTAGRYLRTSPEYAMKRLLAAGSGSIFQIAHAFRQDEQGRADC